MQKKAGILGMAFVQKRNQIVAVKKAIDHPQSDNGKAYFNAKTTYENLRVSALNH